MAISTGSAVFVYGTQATVISDASAIAAGAFNAGTVTVLTQTIFAPLGDAVLSVTMASAPAAGKSFHLYRRDMNIDGTSDATAPSLTYKNTYVGSFPLALVATAQTISLTDIPMTIDQEFYIENDSAVATSGTTVLKVTPKSFNVAA